MPNVPALRALRLRLGSWRVLCPMFARRVWASGGGILHLSKAHARTWSTDCFKLIVAGNAHQSVISNMLILAPGREKLASYADTAVVQTPFQTRTPMRDLAKVRARNAIAFANFFGVAQGTLLPVWYWAYQIFFGCKEGTRLEAAHKPALANTGACPQHVAQPSSFPESKTCPKHCRLGRPLHWKRLRHWPAHSNSRIGMWWGTVPYKQAYIAREPAFWHYMILKKRLPQD